LKKIKEIIRILGADEPDYPSIISKLTKEDYLIVNKLTKNRSSAIATRAIICLGWLGSEEFVESIAPAAKSEDPSLRVAAVQAFGKIKGANKNQLVVNLVNGLLDDKEVAIRKFALKTTGIAGISTLKEKIKQISENDQSDKIKKLAGEVLQKLKIVDDTPIL